MSDRSPEELAERARGALKPKHLTKTSGLVFTHLYDDPLVEYLRPDEQPHYVLSNEQYGFRITHRDGSEETPHHVASEGKRYLMVTDRRLVYVVGRPDGDEMLEFPYGELASARSGEDTSLVFETEGETTYKFSNDRLSADEAAAASYVEERIAEVQRAGGEPAAEEPPGGQPPTEEPRREQRPGGRATTEGPAGRRGEGRRPDLAPAADPIPPSDAITTPARIDAAYDDFERGDQLGSGGTAQVYHAWYCDRELALKVPQFEGTMAASALDAFVGEVETWAGIDDHDHVVGVLDWGREPLPWLAMEYMDAGSLAERVGRVGVAEGLWYVLAVARALRHAHTHGVAHLDVTPENVLLRSTPDAAWPVPKVADWGLARQLLDDGGDRTGVSLSYAAPEQLDSGGADPDNRTDVYQLGAVAYELFTGRPPFEGPEVEVVDAIRTERPTPPSHLDPDLPAELDDVLLTALSKDPADRHEDVLLFRDAVEELLDAEAGRGASAGADRQTTGPRAGGSADTGRIALLESFEVDEADVDADADVTDPDELQAFLDAEERRLEEMADHVDAAGADVVLAAGPVDDLAADLLAQRGIESVGELAREDVVALAEAGDGAFVVPAALPALGADDLVEGAVPGDRSDDPLRVVVGDRRFEVRRSRGDETAVDSGDIDSVAELEDRLASGEDATAPGTAGGPGGGTPVSELRRAARDGGVDLPGGGVTGYGELEQNLNLNAIAIGLGLESVTYEPDAFPGLVYRADPATTVLFGDGTVVAIDAPDAGAAERAVAAAVDRLADLGLVEGGAPPVEVPVDAVPLADEVRP